MINNFQRSLAGFVVTVVVVGAVGICTGEALAAERGERGSAGSAGSAVNGTSKASVSIQTEVNGEMVENIHYEEVSRDGEPVEVYADSYYATSSSEAGGVNVSTSVRSEAHTGGNSVATSPGVNGGTTTSTTSSSSGKTTSSEVRDFSREPREERSDLRADGRGETRESVLLRYKSNASANALVNISASSSATSSATSTKPATTTTKRWWQRVKVFFYGLFIR